MKILISGGGELGRMIAEDLIHTGDTIIVIELNANTCERLAEELNAVIIHGDATMPLMLEKAGIVDVDVVVTATNNDQSNLITAIVAREYGVNRINQPVRRLLLFSLMIERHILIKTPLTMQIITISVH